MGITPGTGLSDRVAQPAADVPIALASTLAPDRTQPAPSPTGHRALPSLAVRWVVALSVTKVAFHLATSAMYGLHRDEFYYLAAGQHPALGYVDQPPLTPMLDRLAAEVFGTSTVGLHVIPALAGGALVVLAALLARELGGGRVAQGLAGLVALVGPLYLTPAHFLSTVTVDLLAWALGSWLVIRLVRTGDTRLWIAVGLVVGVGLENKHTMALWCLGVAVALLATPERRLLASRWLVAGVALATACFIPNLVWQAEHHWASIEFLAHLRQRVGAVNLVQFLPTQLGLATVVGPVVWIGGLRWMLRPGDGRRYRFLPLAYLVVLILVLASSGKGYYVGSLYLPLVAAGAVVIERGWDRRSQRRVAVAIAVTGALMAPLFTPILPASALRVVPLAAANPDLGAMLGWRHVVDQIAATYRSLPASQRAQAVILTYDYSEAGALNYWRGSLGLPPAISGHNNYWWWGWGQASQASITIAVGLPRDRLLPYFVQVERVATLGDDRAQIDPFEQGRPVWVCTGQRLPWAALWPRLRLYA
jgi:uncharacterized membrane protein